MITKLLKNIPFRFEYFQNLGHPTALSFSTPHRFQSGTLLFNPYFQFFLPALALLFWTPLFWWSLSLRDSSYSRFAFSRNNSFNFLYSFGFFLFPHSNFRFHFSEDFLLASNLLSKCFWKSALSFFKKAFPVSFWKTFQKIDSSAFLRNNFRLDCFRLSIPLTSGLCEAAFEDLVDLSISYLRPYYNAAFPVCQ